MSASSLIKPSKVSFTFPQDEDSNTEDFILSRREGEFTLPSFMFLKLGKDGIFVLIH
jgi:hypothetical protein